MDPNEVLARIREVIRSEWLDGGADYEVPESHSLILDLDNWLSRGGFLPEAWQTSRRPPFLKGDD